MASGESGNTTRMPEHMARSVLDQLRSNSPLAFTRHLIGAIGLLAILALGLARLGMQAEVLALVAVAALGVAVVMGGVESWRAPRAWAVASRQSASDPQSRSRWLFAFSAAAVGAAVAIQMWFAPATAVAGGDITFPNGVAWLGRLFSPWVFSGSNLGGPGLLQQQIPWGLVLGVVHSVGGSAELAQRIWYTALFVGAGVSTVALLKTLGMRALPALCGAAAYLFNGYVLGWVTVNSTYMAALALLPALIACVLAGAKGSFRISTSAILLAVSAPVLGFASNNPALVAMLLLAVLACPLLAAWLGGRAAAKRGLLVIALGLPLLILAALYWIVPQSLAYTTLGNSSLASTSAWLFTEIRATLGNALWLNTAWGWAYPAQYVPYAPDYLLQPLALAKYLLPALAFASVAFLRGGSASTRASGVRRLRIAVAFAGLALLFVFLSTGTKPPGSLIFDGLYSLPGGFVLREPGRFLMFAALAYCVLVAVAADAAWALVRHTTRKTFPSISLRSLRGAIAHFFAVERALSRQTAAASIRSTLLRWAPVAVTLLFVAALVPAYPLMTGAIVAGQRANLPSTHVDLPAYWQRMFDDINSNQIAGALLVLPPDDFYQMPYLFGYYGADSFITKAIARHVILPNPQGYLQTSPELLGAVKEAASSLLSSNDAGAARIMAAMQASLVLVRGDIDPNDFLMSGRHIDPPQSLSSALKASPHFQLVRREGPLELFHVTDSVPTELSSAGKFASINTATPDLSILSVLPTGTDLVTETPQSGVTSVFVLPELSRWAAIPGKLSTALSVPSGWRYRLAQVGAQPKMSMSTLGGNGDSQVVQVNAPLGVQELVTDGDFKTGLWQARAGDCNALVRGAKPINGALVRGPSGRPAMRLSAGVDSACESTALSWKSGRILIRLMVRHVTGAAPRLCLWDSNSGLCTAAPPLPSGSGWLQYQAAVTPSQHANLRLFLYADARGGSLTVNEYSDVEAFELPAAPNAVLIGTPVREQTDKQLLVLHDSYSSSWHGPSGGRHVLVDGLMNGWIGRSLSPSVAYGPTPFFTAAASVSAAMFVGLVGFGAFRAFSGLGRGRRPRVLAVLIERLRKFSS